MAEQRNSKKRKDLPILSKLDCFCKSPREMRLVSESSFWICKKSVCVREKYISHQSIYEYPLRFEPPIHELRGELTTMSYLTCWWLAIKLAYIKTTKYGYLCLQINRLYAMRNMTKMLHQKLSLILSRVYDTEQRPHITNKTSFLSLKLTVWISGSFT